MEIRNTFDVLENLLAKKASSSTSQNPTALTKETAQPPTGSTKDVIALQNGIPAKPPRASRLISEDIEKLEKGFRRIQEFETPKGKSFTRIEEVTNSEDRSKRLVIQQNGNGSTTILENILDAQENGAFRQTQRFTNEIGETTTNIEFDVTANNINQLLGNIPTPENKPPEAFQPLRGTQFDIVT